jgi:hypothetical protein
MASITKNKARKIYIDGTSIDVTEINSKVIYLNYSKKSILT